MHNVGVFLLAYIVTLLIVVPETTDTTVLSSTPNIPINPEKLAPDKPTISEAVPAEYFDYEGVRNHLKKLHHEAPDLTELGTYGVSTEDRELLYLRIHNPYSTAVKRKVLITAGIHGNEKFATASMLGIIGQMLESYGDDEQTTRLIDTRDIYFIPVVSPDSYERNLRNVDGVDPNRDFPHPNRPHHKSIRPIQALRNLFQGRKFEAAICGHSAGRVLIYPYGWGPTKNEAEYKSLLEEMGQLNNYSNSRSNNIGTAKDFYHANGAIAITWEFGTSLRPPERYIQQEVDRTYRSMLLFIEKAPQIRVR
jgi:predicted deacylase